MGPLVRSNDRPEARSRRARGVLEERCELKLGMCGLPKSFEFGWRTGSMHHACIELNAEFGVEFHALAVGTPVEIHAHLHAFSRRRICSGSGCVDRLVCFLGGVASAGIPSLLIIPDSSDDALWQQSGSVHRMSCRFLLLFGSLDEPSLAPDLLRYRGC